MPKTYDEVGVEDAKEYFLLPLKDPEAVHYLGTLYKLNALKIVMDADKIIATGGVTNEKCYIMLDMDNKELKELLEKMNQVLVESAKTNAN